MHKKKGKKRKTAPYPCWPRSRSIITSAGNHQSNLDTDQSIRLILGGQCNTHVKLRVRVHYVEDCIGDIPEMDIA